MWLYNVHINPYSHRGYVDHDPKRRRKLLLHKAEIRKLIGKTIEKGLTLVPLRMYFKRGRIKVALSLVQRQAAARQARDDPPARGRSRDPRGGEGTRPPMSGARRAAAPIRFNRPAVTGREPQYIAEALASGHLSGDGAFTAPLPRRRSRRSPGASRVLLTTSCTHALEMAALLLGIGAGRRGDLPVVHVRLDGQRLRAARRRPVFVDIRPDTLNLDERLLEAAITPRTRAIVPVHYAGVGCEMDALEAIARRHGLRGDRGQRPRPVRPLPRPAARQRRRHRRR